MKPIRKCNRQDSIGKKNKIHTEIRDKLLSKSELVAKNKEMKWLNTDIKFEKILNQALKTPVKKGEFYASKKVSDDMRTTYLVALIEERRIECIKGNGFLAKVVIYVSVFMCM